MSKVSEFRNKYGIPFTKQNCELVDTSAGDPNCSTLAYYRLETGPAAELPELKK